jgi:hypothetical protein
MTNPHDAPRQVLRDALTARCVLQSNPVTLLVELADKAGVSIHSIAKASIGNPVNTIDHLRLCAALEVDPLGGMGPAHYGLHKGFPTPSSFDFAFFAMGLIMRQRLNRHDNYKACKAIGIKAGTLERLKMGHAQPIGPVLRACGYIGVHPFGYCAVVKAVPVSRETNPHEVRGISIYGTITARIPDW